MEFKVGQELPSFTLPDQEGNEFSIDKLKGEKKMVIFFYPKDESAGCTKEVCSFRDSYEEFQDQGCEVIGISSDSPKKHKKFAENQNLPFTLLSDRDKKVRKMMGVKGNMFGLIPGRETFVIDQKGVLIHRFNSQMKFDEHKNVALKALREF